MQAQKITARTIRALAKNKVVSYPRKIASKLAVGVLNARSIANVTHKKIQCPSVAQTVYEKSQSTSIPWKLSFADTRVGCLSAPQGCEKFNTKRGLDFKHGINFKRHTDQVAPDYAEQVAPKNIDYNKDAPESDNATAKADDNTCVAQDCDAGLPYCLEQCGSGPHYEGYCACYLHSNPKSICRQQGM